MQTVACLFSWASIAAMIEFGFNHTEALCPVPSKSARCLGPEKEAASWALHHSWTQASRDSLPHLPVRSQWLDGVPEVSGTLCGHRWGGSHGFWLE